MGMRFGEGPRWLRTRTLRWSDELRPKSVTHG